MTILPQTDCPRCAAVITELSQSHLGMLSGPAIRRALRIETAVVDLIALDFRKLHEWNDIIGRERADTYLARLGQVRTTDRPIPPGSTPRKARQPGDARDLAGQYGGDELVLSVPAGDGWGLLARLVRTLNTMTLELSDAERAAIVMRTGGLLTGFAAVLVLVERSTRPFDDAARAVDECGILKRGGLITGNRASTGRPGTIVGTLPATIDV